MLLNTSDIIFSSHLLYTVICVASETETIAVRQSINKQSHVRVRVCVQFRPSFTSTSHRPDQGIICDNTDSLRFYCGITKQSDAEWIGLSLRLLSIIPSSVIHTAFLFIQCPVCTSIQYYSTQVENLLIIHCCTEYYYHAASGRNRTDHNWIKYLLSNSDIIAVFYLICILNVVNNSTENGSITFDKSIENDAHAV